MTTHDPLTYRFTDYTAASPDSARHYTDLVTANLQHRMVFPGRPIVFPATDAHVAIPGGATPHPRVAYLDADESFATPWGTRIVPRGTAILNDPAITGAPDPVLIPPKRQKSLIRLILHDVSDVVSDVANAPALPNGQTIAAYAHDQVQRYEAALHDARNRGQHEADMGNYVYDPVTDMLYLIPEEYLYWLASITSHSFFKDYHDTWSLYEIWERFKQTQVGIMGASVGSNIAVATERKLGCALKLADFDHTTIGNVRRIAGGCLDFLGDSKAAREDAGNPDEMPRPFKAAQVARRILLLNPYAQIQVFLEGIDHQNIDAFLDGLDICVEEIDTISYKVDPIRIKAREYQIPVLTMTDIDYRVGAEFADYRTAAAPLANFVDDATLLDALDHARHGGRAALWRFAELLFGSEIREGLFGAFINEQGVHVTSSIPQQADVAMGAGYIAACYIAYYVLGFPLPKRAYFTPGDGYVVYR